jgi:adenylosuccinate synthase
MSCTLILGGQYGSEGKGKVTALLASTCAEPWVVRCGGPNSGHSVWNDDRQIILRQLPTAALHPASTVLVGAGCAIDENLLIQEATDLGLPRDRVVVDPRAVVIEHLDHDEELADIATIASTASGTNSAWIRRMRRRSDAKLAGTSARLRDAVRVECVAALLHQCLENHGDVIVEGTQGFGLSLLHGDVYPYVTARDTSAGGFCSEVGLSPRHVDHIVMVLRTFPIRVGGNSGPLPNEIDWAEVRKFSGAPTEEPEFTSVTHRIRRVAHFDLTAVQRACRYNKPTSLALMGLDRLDHVNRGVLDTRDLTRTAVNAVRELEQATSTGIEWVGTGFRTADAIRTKHITRPSNSSLDQICPSTLLV